jgi:hypothetical protein
MRQNRQPLVTTNYVFDEFQENLSHRSGQAAPARTLGDVADVLADQRFDFQLEAVFEHQVDLFLPRLLVRTRGTGDLLGPLDVLSFSLI